MTNPELEQNGIDHVWQVLLLEICKWSKCRRALAAVILNELFPVTRRLLSDQGEDAAEAINGAFVALLRFL